jgi:hypothetical protein
VLQGAKDQEKTNSTIRIVLPVQVAPHHFLGIQFFLGNFPSLVSLDKQPKNEKENHVHELEGDKNKDRRIL